MKGGASRSRLPRLRRGDVVAVVHGAWGESLDEEDTREQAREVAGSLERLGMMAPVIALDPDLVELRQVRECRPRVIFNLVEGLGGWGVRAHEAAVSLAGLSVPLTGVSGAIQGVVNSKVVCKEALRQAGLPTPPWSRTGAEISGDDLWIVKPEWEHGSLNMDDGSVVAGGLVAAALARRNLLSPHVHFSERYIEGREFNVSVLENPGGGGDVLPVVEMLFVNYTDQALRIVDYAAKWDSGSFGFNNTPRRFDFSSDDAPLLEQLRRLSLAVWDLFRLEGYIRVDFRVDAAGQPWILEVNANPCLSRSAGFVVTVLRAGIDYDQLIWRLLQAALGWPELSSGDEPDHHGFVAQEACLS